jgi:hypothetical protein
MPELPTVRFTIALLGSTLNSHTNCLDLAAASSTRTDSLATAAPTSPGSR